MEVLEGQMLLEVMEIQVVLLPLKHCLLAVLLVLMEVQVEMVVLEMTHLCLVVVQVLLEQVVLLLLSMLMEVELHYGT
jgi:hypothetical protein